VEEVQKAFKTGELKFSTGYASLFYHEAKKWVDNGDLTSLGRWLQMGKDNATLHMGNRHVDNGQILKSKLWGASPSAVLDYGTTLDDLLIEGYTKIIMGVEPIDYYDTLIDSWRKAGGDEVTAAVNEMYGN
jgi:putative aldouronate transport system substrate-binding protein